MGAGIIWDLAQRRWQTERQQGRGWVGSQGPDLERPLSCHLPGPLCHLEGIEGTGWVRLPAFGGARSDSQLHPNLSVLQGLVPGSWLSGTFQDLPFPLPK